MANLIGQSLGRFHIREQIGEGGMAIVYKAYDTRLERDVAVKIIRRGAFPADHLEHMLKRFEREARALARLSHTNILKVLDYGEYEGSPYLVLEYLPGGTLKQKMGKPIPWRDAIRTLIPVAEALEYAHERGIIHRDIKPSNILLTEANQPLLTDFGIAKILETNDTTTLTGTGMGVGTPEYMAPEQWTGQATSQSDIYSLGIVLYEMVTGRKPYTADTPAAILLMQATEPLPRPTSFVPDLPEGVEKTLIKALTRNPRDRFESMKAFSEAMEGLLKGQPVGFRSDPVPVIPSLVSDTHATINQGDTRATHIQGATRDTMSMSRVEMADKKTPDSIAPGKNTKNVPNWSYILAAGIGGLLLLSLCIGVAISIGIIGRPAQPLQTDIPAPAIQPENIIFPTETRPPQAPTKYKFSQQMCRSRFLLTRLCLPTRLCQLTHPRPLPRPCRSIRRQ
jgi:serine/threonine protein kinase